MNLFAGALAGYLVGSGIEDLLQQASINPPIEYMKSILSGVSALGFSTLGTLQYFNRDEHEGMLVVHIVEDVETKKTSIQPQPNLEGIANTFETITYGIKNKEFAQKMYNKLAKTLTKNPLRNAKTNYAVNKQGFFASSFEIFNSFGYQGREIKPTESLDKFFENGENLYKLFVERVSNISSNLTEEKNSLCLREKNEWTNNFRIALNHQVEYAKDIALWVTYLSKRSGIVGTKVREQLSEIGIKDPNYLPRDTEILGNNLLNFYDRLVQSRDI